MRSDIQPPKVDTVAMLRGRMGGMRDEDSVVSAESSLRRGEVVLLLLTLPDVSLRDWVAEVRSLLGVTDVESIGTVLTPHPSVGLEKVDRARMIPLRRFEGVGDTSNRGSDIAGSS